MNLKRFAIKALQAAQNRWSMSWKYWGKKPGEILAMRRQKALAGRKRRQNRRRWGHINRRYPVGSHRRTS